MMTMLGLCHTIRMGLNPLLHYASQLTQFQHALHDQHCQNSITQPDPLLMGHTAVGTSPDSDKVLQALGHLQPLDF
jgi:hypothetical protein